MEENGSLSIPAAFQQTTTERNNNSSEEMDHTRLGSLRPSALVITSMNRGPIGQPMMKSTTIMGSSLNAAGSCESNRPTSQVSPPPPSTFPTISPVPYSCSKSTNLSSGGSVNPRVSSDMSGTLVNNSVFTTNTLSSYVPMDAMSTTSSTTSVAASSDKKSAARKEKSLTTICTKFIQFYEERTKQTTQGNKGDIKIDEAVTALGRFKA